MKKFDVRTHLFALVIATIFWIVFSSNLEIHLFTVLCALYLCVAGYKKATLKFILTYLIMELLALATAPLLGIMYIVISTFARAVPLMMIAAPILYENPSRMMGSFQRIHIPKTIVVMICILLRFFPVIQKEMVSIFNGVRARGIFPNWKSIIRHPFMAYECFFVPLTVRCLKLSSELGASAELRGLDSSNPRSCIYDIRYTYMDGLLLVGLFIGCLAILLGVK